MIGHSLNMILVNLYFFAYSNQSYKIITKLQQQKIAAGTLVSSAREPSNEGRPPICDALLTPLTLKYTHFLFFLNRE